MNHISNFIKNHPLLCAGTIGIVIIGYLGYRAVKWIIKKSHKTNDIELLAKKNLKQTSFSSKQELVIPSIPNSNDIPIPNSIINRVSDLKINSDKITTGQGEYVVFHRLPDGEKKHLAPETFEKIYPILLQFSPLAMINNEDKDQCANRYQLIKDEIKKIDSSLEVVFIPRTLFELFFIRKCIREDIKNKKICSFLDPYKHQIALEQSNNDQNKYVKFIQDKKTDKKCWHLCYFTDAGEDDHPGVKNVAFRLNQLIVKKLNPQNEGFTYQEFLAHVEKEIEFLKAHLKTSTETALRRIKGEKFDDNGKELIDITNCNSPGPTTNFGFESTRGLIKPMGIRNENDAQIIRNAIALECSKMAQHSLFLYRGTDFQKDYPISWNDQNIAYSLSYGASLFAGCLFDGGATSFHYLRKEKNAYAIPIPFIELNRSPFFAPTTHIVSQLFADGEIFHARTKAWENFDMKQLDGMNLGENGHKREQLKSNLSKEEFLAQFQDYKNQAYQLK